MLKDILKNNEKATATQSNIEILKKSFPQCFNKDGSFDAKKFETIITQNSIDITNEGYELNFLGKSYSKLLTSFESETIIVPNIEHNSMEENKKSENFYIAGDNIDALKHLLKSYSGSIKCIYIDPPYNTGGDGFVYMDNFKFTSKQLSEKIGITEEEAQRILRMTTKNSSSHSAWLTFMYARISLAKDLLDNDGVMFISIDDNEQANLKLLCDEIFREENFIGNITVQTNKGGQDYLELAKTHEYILCYSKNDDALLNKLDKENTVGTKLSDKKGEYELRELRNRNPKFTKSNRPNLYYPIYVNPNVQDKHGCNLISLERTSDFCIEVFPLNKEGNYSCWRWGKKLLFENIDFKNIEDCQVVARKKSDGNYNIYEKYRGTQSRAKTIWDSFEQDFIWDESEVRTEKGTKRLKEVLGDSYFDHPKPVELVERVIQLACNSGDTIVDFFSGSGTTAEAVMRINSKQLKKIKYICVQLPEDMDEALANASSLEVGKYKKIIDFLDSINKPHLLSEIGIERIKKAGEMIKADTNADIDYGFKIYDLNTPPRHTIDKMQKFDPDKLLADKSLLTEFGVETILTTWLVHDGYGFNGEIKTLDLNGYNAYQCENTLYLIDSEITSEAIKKLVEKYLNEPAFSPNRMVIFGYSFNFTQLSQLKDNLKQLPEYRKIDIITRY